MICPGPRQPPLVLREGQSHRPSDRIVVSVAIDECASMAYIRMVGDIDLAAEPALSDAVRRLSVSVCRRVSVNLAEVRLAGAALLSFLAGGQRNSVRSDSRRI